MIVNGIPNRGLSPEILEPPEDEDQYRLAVIDHMALQGAGVCLFMALLDFILYFSFQHWSLIFQGLAFLLTALLNLWYWRQAQTQGYRLPSARLVIAGVMWLTFVTMWLTYDRLVQPAAMVLIHMIFVSAYCESRRGMRGWIIVATLVFLGSMLLRQLYPPPLLPDSFIEPLVYYTFPILIMVISGRFGQLTLDHLRNALTQSNASHYALQQAYASIEQQVHDRTAELQAANQELAAANQHLSIFATQAEELATLKERTRISRDIHDGLGHYLTMVTWQLKGARAVFDTDPHRARESMEEAYQSALDALRETQRSVVAFRELPVNSTYTLTERIALLVKKNHTADIRPTFVISGTSRTFPTDVEDALYRTVQEALTNVRKHASHALVEVTLDFTQPSRVHLRIRDEGPGATSLHGGFGLIGIRERIENCGGSVSFHTAPGQGFVVEAEVPE